MQIWRPRLGLLAKFTTVVHCDNNPFSVLFYSDRDVRNIPAEEAEAAIFNLEKFSWASWNRPNDFSGFPEIVHKMIWYL